MRYLLDTHTLIWFLAGDESLSATARGVIEDPANDILVSAATAWEIATKFRIGKLPNAALLATNFVPTVTGLNFTHLPITAGAAQKAGGWIVDHKDPFDRILAAQSALENAPLLTTDPDFDLFGITRMW